MHSASGKAAMARGRTSDPALLEMLGGPLEGVPSRFVDQPGAAVGGSSPSHLVCILLSSEQLNGTK
jgi:hypothetical protein